MPTSANARSSSLPAGPTNGNPARSSWSPGCSPTSMTQAWACPPRRRCGSPTPRGDLPGRRPPPDAACRRPRPRVGPALGSVRPLTLPVVLARRGIAGAVRGVALDVALAAPATGASPARPEEERKHETNGADDEQDDADS